MSLWGRDKTKDSPEESGKNELEFLLGRDGFGAIRCLYHGEADLEIEEENLSIIFTSGFGDSQKVKNLTGVETKKLWDDIVNS